MAEGTYRPDRHGNCAVPLGRPLKPRGLSKEAAKLWPKVLDRLEAVGVLAATDVALIARYCEESVRQDRFERTLAKYGDIQVFKDPYGGIKCAQPSCWLSMLNKSETKLRRMEQELGLTPAARASLHVAPTQIPVVSSRNRNVS